MTTASRPALILILFLAIVSIFYSCARQGAVPGGPEDRTPPQLDSVVPAPGTTNVSTSTTLEIYFDERVEPKSVERAVFITPQPKKDPKIKVKGNRVIIEFVGGLDSNRTYVTNLGIDLQDAHRVSLDKSLTFAFSTGAVIDTGEIAGRVYTEHTGTAGISLALFSENPGQSGLVIDSLIPEYLTQSGLDGVYKFQFLPVGIFYLVAFEDKNKDRRINFGKEKVGVPFQKVDLGDGIFRRSNTDIKITSSDTSKISLRSISFTIDKLLRIRLNRPVDSVKAHQIMAAFQIQSLKDSSQILRIQDYLNANDYPADEFMIRVTDPVPGLEYNGRVDRKMLYPEIADSLRYSSYSFKASDVDDNNPPHLLRSYPDDKEANVDPGTDIRLVFSEPMSPALNAQAITLKSSDGVAVPITLEPWGSFIYRGKPQKTLEFGKKYDISLDLALLSDRAGIRMGDSILTRSFTTIGADTLGQISGTISNSKAEWGAYPVVLDFIPVKDGRVKVMELIPGQSTFLVDLLPGNYIISAYLDQNSNGQYDFGSIIPYEYSEPFAVPADTIRVRSRFESAGVEIEFK